MPFAYSACRKRPSWPTNEPPTTATLGATALMAG